MAMLGQILGYAVGAILVLLVAVEVALRAYNGIWFFTRLFWGRLTLQEMRNRNWWF